MLPHQGAAGTGFARTPTEVGCEARMFGQIVNVVLSGLATGLSYGLLLAGILLVYQVSRVINFAYGEYGAVAALTTYYLADVRHMPLAVAIAGGLLVAMVLSGITELALIRPLGEVGRSGRDFLVSLGVLLLLTAGAQELFGVNPQSFPSLGENVTRKIAGVQIDLGQLIAMGVGIAAIIAVYLMIVRSDTGLRLRAVAERPDVSTSLGLNVYALRLFVWVLSGVLAGIGGMLFASQLSVDPFYMTNIIIVVFIAGMLGGLESYWLPIGCAVGLGLFESIVEYIFGANSGTPADFIAVMLIFAVLPKRAVGERETERA